MNLNQQESQSNFENNISAIDFTSLDVSEVDQKKAIADSFEFISCYRKETYSGQVIPYGASSVVEQVVVSVPSDYEIFAIDFNTSFPASIQIQKYADKKWVWTIHIMNLHGRHRPVGTYNISVFSQSITS